MNIRNQHELPYDFCYFIELLVDDVITIAEKGHNTGAFTAINAVLAECFKASTGVDPFNQIMPVMPDEVLAWAKSLPTTKAFFKRKNEASEDMIQIIQIIANSLDKAVKLDGASFGFVIGLLVTLSRAYLVVTGNDILPLIKDTEANKRLIEWAWSF